MSMMKILKLSNLKEIMTLIRGIAMREKLIKEKLRLRDFRKV